MIVLFCGWGMIFLNSLLLTIIITVIIINGSVTSYVMFGHQYISSCFCNTQKSSHIFPFSSLLLRSRVIELPLILILLLMWSTFFFLLLIQILMSPPLLTIFSLMSCLMLQFLISISSFVESLHHMMLITRLDCCRRLPLRLFLLAAVTLWPPLLPP